LTASDPPPSKGQVLAAPTAFGTNANAIDNAVSVDETPTDFIVVINFFMRISPIWQSSEWGAENLSPTGA
jgi:hypothetical protein